MAYDAYRCSTSGWVLPLLMVMALGSHDGEMIGSAPVITGDGAEYIISVAATETPNGLMTHAEMLPADAPKRVTVDDDKIVIIRKAAPRALYATMPNSQVGDISDALSRLIHLSWHRSEVGISRVRR